MECFRTGPGAMTIQPGLHASTLMPLLGALLMFTPALALGQLPKDQQSCINELNKGFAKVAKKQAKEVCTCIKEGAQGKLSGQTIEECTTADNKGKVADAKQKTISKAADKCSGPAPPFGATDATTVNAAAMAKEILLIHDLFGTDLDQNIILKASDPAVAFKKRTNEFRTRSPNGKLASV